MRAAEKEQKRRLKLRVVIEHAVRHLNSDKGLHNTKEVQESVKEEHGIDVKTNYISQVISNDLGCRWKRIRRVP